MENRAIEHASAAAVQAAQWSRDEIDTIKKTVAEGASDAELKMFLHLSGTYGLDPFARDIWFIKAGGKPIIMTSRDGYLKIANRDAHFMGLDSDVVYSHDRFRRINGNIEHIYGFDESGSRGIPIGAYAIAKRDDRDPLYCWAPWGDYNKGNSTWKQYKHAMILKVAETMALKRAFSISGMVTQEELDEDELKARQERWEAQKQAQEARRAANRQKEQLYQRYVAVCANVPQHAQNAMLKVTGGKGSRDWTADDLAALEADVTKREEELNNAAMTFDAQVEPETAETPEADHFGEAAEMLEATPA
ncbi:MAG: recombinase RecT [Synergistaceae bacterium]|nr:recombinase RecT [Synergistaceae bacterium]